MKVVYGECEHNISSYHTINLSKTCFHKVYTFSVSWDKQLIVCEEEHVS